MDPQEENNEVEALDTALFRFVATDDAKFEDALAKSLPRVLALLTRPSERVRGKVIEILNHINKRIQIQPKLQLPVAEIIDLLGSEQGHHPFLSSFCLSYAENGLARLPSHQRAALVPKLLLGIASRSSAQQNQILHVFLDALPHFKYPLPSEEELRTHFAFVFHDADRAVVLSFLLDVLLYIPQSSGVPPGLSPEGTERVSRSGKLVMTTDEWSTRKEFVLDFVVSGLHPMNETLPHIIVASTTGSQQLVFKAEGAYRRVKPEDFEKPSVVKQLIEMFLGEGDKKNVTETARRTPVHLNIKLKILQALTRSMTAANQGVLTLQIIVASAFGKALPERVRVAGINFLVWVISKAPEKLLAQLSPLFIQALLKMVIQPSTSASASSAPASSAPAKDSANTAAEDADYNHRVRGLAFTTLGQLAMRQPTQFVKDSKILVLFFKALQDETDTNLRQNIHEGLSMLRDAYQAASIELLKEIQNFLLNIDFADHRVKLSALQYMNKLFPFSDTPSRFFCLLLAQDPATEVAEEAKRNLVSEDKEDENVTAQFLERKERPYPSFPEFVGYAVQRLEYFRANYSYYITPFFLQRLLTFIQKCLSSSATAKGLTEAKYAEALRSSGSDLERNSLPMFQQLIEESFNTNLTEIQQTSSASLVQLVRCGPEIFGPMYSSPAKLRWLKNMLLKGMAVTRYNIGQLLRIIGKDLALDMFLSLFEDLSSVLETSKDHDTIHGAMLGIGGLLTSSAPASNTRVPSTAAEKSLKLIAAQLSSPPYLAAIACEVIGDIADCGPLPLAPTDLAQDTTVDRGFVIRKLSKLLKGESRKEDRLTEFAARALGKIGKTDRDPAVLSSILRSLFAMVNLKLEEVHFAVGEALSDVGMGTMTFPPLSSASSSPSSPTPALSPSSGATPLPVPSSTSSFSSVDNDVSFELASSSTTGASSSTSTVTSPSDASSPTPMQVDGEEEKKAVASPSAVEESATKKLKSGQPMTAIEHILNKILYEHIPKGSLIARTSASIWLLCLVKFAPDHPRVHQLLPQIQMAFSQGLTESQQFLQEVAAKGLSQLYQRCGKDMQEQLVSSLVRTFSVGARKITGDTEIEINSEKGEFASYKELCSVATEMGQPDLVYKFMDLATHHSVWNSKLGAAFSLGSIADLSKALSPQLKSIIPKLYRYQYDPNEKIRSSMKLLWRSLAPEERKTIDDNWKPVVEELFNAIESREWRNREAGCMALADVLSGRKFSEVESFLERLWLVSFRIVDDLKETVRKAANTLAKSTVKLTERLCDPTYTSNSDATATLAVVLPLLIHKGITDKVQEVRMISIQTVLKITKVAGKLLRPHLADLFAALLEGISSLEPQMFSYLQFHTESLELSQEQLESMRLSVSKASPLSAALETCMLQLDNESIGPVVAQINRLVKEGLGLPTLSACAKCITNICTSDLAIHLKDHASSLLKTFQEKLMDQSPSLRKIFASTIGHLCKVLKRKRVSDLVDDMISLYTQKGSEKERLVSAITMQAMIRRAPDVLKDYHGDVMPVVFVGMYDISKEVVDTSTETWEEVMASVESGLKMYLPETVKLISSLLNSSIWELKKIGLKSLQEAIRLTGASFATHTPTVLPLLLESLPGRIWDGKELVLDAVVSLATETKAALKPQVEVKKILQLVKAETQRNKRSYKRHAIESFGRIANEFPSLDLCAEMRPILEPIINPALVAQAEAKESTTETSLNEDEAKEKARADDKENSLLIAKALDCLGQLFPRPEIGDALYLAQKEAVSWIFPLFSSVTIGSSWNVRVSLASALKRMLKHIVIGADVTKPALLTSEMISEIARILGVLLTDKHSVVRVAALDVIQELFARSEAKAIALPQKDKFQALVSSVRQDSEPSVLQAVAKVSSSLQ